MVTDFKFHGERYEGVEAGHTLILFGYISEEYPYISRATRRLTALD